MRLSRSGASAPLMTGDKCVVWDGVGQEEEESDVAVSAPLITGGSVKEG